MCTILYHRWPDCGKAHLSTPEGLVEILGDVVDAVESAAKKVTMLPEDDFAFGEELARAGAVAQVHAPPSCAPEPAESKDSTDVES